MGERVSTPPLAVERLRPYSSDGSENEAIDPTFFVDLLAEVCNGKYESLPDPLEVNFWTEFAALYTKIKQQPVTANSCETHAQALRRFYCEIQVENNPLRNLSQLDNVMKQLQSIFTNQPYLARIFNEEASSSFIPETHSMNFNQADPRLFGFPIPAEMEMDVQTTLVGLANTNLVNLRDIADAQSYLSRSSWASTAFLGQKTSPEKAAALILSAQTSREEQKKRKIWAREKLL